MNIEELKAILVSANIPNNSYSINGSYFSDSYVMQEKKQNGHAYWEIFYIDERGGENDYRCFDKEDIACKYFLYKLLDLNVSANYSLIEKYIINDKKT